MRLKAVDIKYANSLYHARTEFYAGHMYGEVSIDGTITLGEKKKKTDSVVLFHGNEKRGRELTPYKYLKRLYDYDGSATANFTIDDIPSFDSFSENELGLLKDSVSEVTTELLEAAILKHTKGIVPHERDEIRKQEDKYTARAQISGYGVVRLEMLFEYNGNRDRYIDSTMKIVGDKELYSEPIDKDMLETVDSVISLADVSPMLILQLRKNQPKERKRLRELRKIAYDILVKTVEDHLS